MRTNFNSQGVVFEYDLVTQQKSLQLNSSRIPYLIVDNQRISLTNREVDCLNLLVVGCSAKEIAKCLSLSPRTVEFYLQNIKSKIGYYKKSELIKLILNQKKFSDNNLI